MKKLLFAVSFLTVMLTAFGAVTAAEPVYYESFDGDKTELSERWITASLTLVDECALSGTGSLAMKGYSGSSNSDKDVVLRDERLTTGNYAYEVWFHDNGEKKGSALFTLACTNAAGDVVGGINVGYKSNTFNGEYYIWGAKGTALEAMNTQCARTAGWHQFVIDMTTEGKASVYIDGTLIGTKDFTDAVTNIAIVNRWSKSGFNTYFDELRVWESMEDVYPYENLAVEYSGDIQNVSVENPVFNVSAQKAIQTEKCEEVVSVVRSSDNSEVSFELTNVTENGFDIKISDILDYETEYLITVDSSLKTLRFGADMPEDVILQLKTEPDPFVIQNFGFTDVDGVKKLKADIKNSQDKETDICLFAILYKEINGKPQYVKGIYHSQRLTRIDTPTRIITTDGILIPDDGEKYILKGFLWESLLNKKVLQKTTVISVEKEEESVDISGLDAIALTDFYNNKKAAVSITFDDSILDAAQYYDVLFENYNIHGTACMVADWVLEDDIDAWQTLFDNGNIDIANHSKAHEIKYDENSPSAEVLEGDITGGYNKLKQMFPDEKILAFAPPWTRTTSASLEETQKYHIASRKGGGGYVSADLSGTDWFYLPGFVVDHSMSAEALNAKIDTAITDGKWFITLMHGIGEGTYNIDKTVCDEFFGYIGSKNDEIWAGSLNEVIQYIYERQNASVGYNDFEDGKLSIFVRDTLDDELFNFPLTLKVNVPDSWTNIKVTQGDVTEELNTFTQNGKRYVYLNAVPDNGDVILENL